MSSPPKKRTKITETIGLANLKSTPPNAFDSVNQLLLHCPNCTQTIKNRIETSFEPLGVLKRRYIFIECKNEYCSAAWCLCMDCGTKQRTRIFTKLQLNNHEGNMHSERAKRRLLEETIPSTPTTQIDFHGNEDEIMVNGGEDDHILGDIAVDDHQIAVERDGKGVATVDENAAAWTSVVNSNNLGFSDDKKSAAYFQQCYLGDQSTAGMKYLVMRSSRRTDLEATDYSSQQLPAGHADLQTRIANLAFELTRGQTKNLVHVLQGAYKLGCENGFACSQNRVSNEIEKLKSREVRGAAEALKTTLQLRFSHDLVDKYAHTWSTKIPSDWNEVRTMYLEGARSIVSNLPVPTIKTDVPGHSYVSVTECIRHFLAHRDLSDMAIIPGDIQETQGETIEHPSKSARASQIIGNQINGSEHLTSYIFLWSDDVEPNRHKSNRGSVWLLTATIATHLKNGHRLENTFPIAVAKKGEDHGPIVAKLNSEMEELRKGSCPPFYIGRRKKKVKMAFEIFCCLQDQPERRDFNCMGAGNTLEISRFGVSADHRSIYKREPNVLAACAECLATMEKGLSDDHCVWPMDACAKCVRWDVLDDVNGLVLWKKPDGYPTTADRIVRRDGKDYLKPSRISYATLKAAVDTAHDGYVNNSWTETNCKAYLKAEGINGDYIDIVMEHCARSYSYKKANENPQKFRAILEAALSDPSKYRQAPYPPSWVRSCMELELHPDVIMHLLFLGIVKSTVIKIQACLAAQKKLSSFLRSVEKHLKEFQTMSIDWIAIQPNYQGGKLGGWVSENFLGLSRILPWFYQNIDKATATVEDEAPPENLPQKKWLHRHFKYWLKIRGLDSNGKKEELSNRVAEAIERGAPDPLPPPEIPTASYEAVLLSLMEMLQCVMAPKVSPALVNRTRYAIRVFLSRYDSLCRPLREPVPAVISSYNFICLLNLPDVMERFGPLRQIWEGGPRGEGFVRFAKPLMTQGLRQNWHQQLLLRMHRSISFRSILQTDEEESLADKPSDQNALRKRKGKFNMYKAAFHVHRRFLSNRPLEDRVPISVVIARVGGEVKVFAVVRSYEEILHIKLDGKEPRVHFGWEYYCFDSDPSEDGIRWTEIANEVTGIEAGILLPLLDADDTENRFALITEQWKRLAPSVELSDLVPLPSDGD